MDLALGADDMVYVVNRSYESRPDGIRVSVCTLNEEYITEFGTNGEADGQFVWPTAIALDGNENVYVADEWLNRITVFSKDGEFIRKWGKPGSGDVLLIESALRDHNASDNVLLFMFTEFGRRIVDNGSGTDHGAGGVAFVVGENIKGGIYGEYPSLEPGEQEEGGNLKSSMDFRSVYTDILEDWLGLDPVPIVGGNYEKQRFI